MNRMDRMEKDLQYIVILLCEVLDKIEECGVERGERPTFKSEEIKRVLKFKQ